MSDLAAKSVWILIATWLALGGTAARGAAADRPRRAIDESRAAAAGIRKLTSQHLTLFTDLAAAPAVDELPAVFDLAVPQWGRYFAIAPDRLADWHVRGYLMRDKAKFVDSGLLPPTLPPFPNGFSWGGEFWVHEQTSEYYRRHLVLHEGTHSFMFTVLGSCGPPWYMEGMAEMLGTHRWQNGKLLLGYLPASRDEVPMWGRVKIIHDDVAARRAKTLKTVFEYPPQAHRDVEPYGWCWAAATFLDRHPRYRDRFRQMAQSVRGDDFTERFLRLIGDDWDDMAEEWQLFVVGLEYGIDVARTAVDFAPGRSLAGGNNLTLAADRGWQNSGVALEAGATYRLVATGRYQLAEQPQIWWSEPNGVSIRYYKGRPLGMLLAAVHPDRPRSSGASPLLAPLTVGLGATWTPKQSGTLFLRINDSPAELADNAGQLSVHIERVAREGAAP